MLPKIKGSISKCFDEYTHPYIEKESKDLRDPVLKELESELEKDDKFVGLSLELNILPSSTTMFRHSKYFIER